MIKAAVITLVLIASASAAAAEKHEGAEQQFQEAQAAFKLGRFEQALQGYLRAYELKPLPEILFNIAQCHRNLKNYDRAIFFLERYLAEAKKVDDRRAVGALIATLERERDAQRPHLETIRVVTTTVTKVTTATVTLPVLVPVDEPAYTRGWFWGVLAGALVVAGGAIAIAFAVRGEGIPQADREIDLRSK